MSGSAYKDRQLRIIVAGYFERFPDGINFDVFSQMFHIGDLAKLTLNVVG